MRSRLWKIEDRISGIERCLRDRHESGRGKFTPIIDSKGKSDAEIEQEIEEYWSGAERKPGQLRAVIIMRSSDAVIDHE